MLARHRGADAARVIVARPDQRRGHEVLSTGQRRRERTPRHNTGIGVAAIEQHVIGRLGSSLDAPED